MHILVLTENDVASANYGGALRVAALVDQLLKQGIKVSVIRFRLASERASPADGRFPIRGVVVPRGYRYPLMAALFQLVSRASDQIALAFNRDHRIDLIQSDPPWAALAGARIAQKLGVPHMLLGQNCETALAAQLAESGPARQLPFVGRLLAGVGVAVVNWAERRVIAGADLVLTPSPQDRAEMAAVGINSSGVEILPNGTRIRQSPQDDRAAMRRQLGLRPATPTVVFVGRMDYRPNQEAIAAICARIAPRCPGVMFLLVGLNPPPIATPGNVMLIGAVESVEGYLGASDLAIVPILRGSGTRIKILDAWAAGLSVLSTSLGAAGLNYQDGVNIVIEDDIDRFPERIQELVRSPAARADLRKGALAAARPYRWETLGRRYTAFLTALVRARVGRQDTWAGRRHARSPG